MAFNITLELSIDKIMVNTNKDFKYYVLWKYFSFQKNKSRRKKSKKFRIQQRDLANFKTKIQMALPSDLKTQIIEK